MAKRRSWGEIKVHLARRNPELYRQCESYDPDEDAKNGGHQGLSLASRVSNELRACDLIDERTGMPQSQNYPQKQTNGNNRINWQKLTRVALMSFPVYNGKEQMSIDAMRKRLDNLRILNYPARNYESLCRADLKQYLLEVQHKIRVGAQARCPEVLAQVDKLNASLEKTSIPKQ